MADRKKRRALEPGHHRKFLVVVDDSPEFEVALFFAARVAMRTKGRLVMLYVEEPLKLGGWMHIKVDAPDFPQKQAEAKIAEFTRNLEKLGLKGLRTETVFRSGDKAEEILKSIRNDEDIAVLVLGASVSSAGPGPLVSSLVGGDRAGTFPIPIYVVPGGLTHEEIAGLA